MSRNEESSGEPDQATGATSELERKQELNLIDEMGGPQGVADSSLPGLLFVAVYSISGQDLQLSAVAAIGLGAVIGLVRLVRGESIRFAVAGFIGVAIAGFIATRTGRAEDFFLPGLLFNAGYAVAYAVSIAVGWPLMGVLIGPLIGDGMKWRQDPDQVRLFNRMSWIWVALFSTRLAVQLPFYLAGSLVALGIARTAMGLPLFGLGIWLCYLLLRREGVDLRALSPKGSRKADR
ncbi:MAG: DUF3159 domain-containing protein [Solirubrobacterales bacterium]